MKNCKSIGLTKKEINQKRRLFIIVCLLLFCNVVFNLELTAQNVCSVQGIVVNEQREAVPYATINVLSAEKKQLIRAVYSDVQGSFNIRIDSGSYFLEVNHTSYLPHQININCKSGSLKVDTIFLKEKIASLQAVVVTAQKPLVQQLDDKLVYNLAADPHAKSEFATEIMRKVPLLSVDGEGNVKLNGQSNFRVLLNGRETSIFATNLKEALSSFPGNIIERIEVITNPSAKYDAEGVGGIINIVTVKKVWGYNLNLFSAHSTLGHGNFGGSLNLKKGKFGFFVQATQSSLWKDIKSSSSQITTTKEPSSFTKRMLDGTNYADRYAHGINMELNYNMDSLHTLSLFGSLGNNKDESNLMQDIQLYLPGNTLAASRLQQLNSVQSFSHGYGMDFLKKYRNNSEQELSLRFNALTGDFTSSMNSAQEDNTSGRYINNLNDYINNEYTLQLDFIKPIHKSKVETGIKTILRNGNSNYNSLFRNQLSDPFVKDATNSNQYQFNQNVYGAYLSLSHPVKNGRLRAGIRGEYTEVVGRFSTTATSVDQSYMTLIPNLNLSKKVSESMSMQFSYNLRVQRPSIQMLNPFVRNNDSLLLSFGNPSLGIQKLHSFGWQNNLNLRKLFAGVYFNASYTDDKIVQYPLFDQSSGITSFTYGNAGKEYVLSLTANANLRLAKPGAQLGVSYNIKYNSIINRLNKEQKNQGFSYTGSTWFNYPLANEFSISGSGYVGTGQYDLVNSQGLFWGYQINLARQFFQKKLRVSMNLNNMHAQNFRFISRTEDKRFRTENATYNPFRVIYLVVSYTFGKLKEQGAKARVIQNDDQLR